MMSVQAGLTLMLVAGLALHATQAHAQRGRDPAPAHGALAEGPDGRSLTVELETGAVSYARNDVRIPNEGGTLFDLRDLTGSGPELYGRLALTWRLDERHVLRFTAAPLSTSGTGVLEDDVIFEGTEFLGGEPIHGSYQFSNYRVTYRWLFRPGERWQWGLGGSLFVRDAEITLQQGARTATNEDVGLVPLLHVYGERPLGERTQLVVDIEGAAAPQGRAIDAAIRVQRRLQNGMTLGIGYRGLEGGADNDELYAFAWLNYATVSVGWQFR